jgi:hypothetical protein
MVWAVVAGVSCCTVEVDPSGEVDGGDSGRGAAVAAGGAGAGSDAGFRCCRRGLLGDRGGPDRPAPVAGSRAALPTSRATVGTTCAAPWCGIPPRLEPIGEAGAGWFGVPVWRCGPGRCRRGCGAGPLQGPLALFAQAARRGITVEGQQGAIETICSWLDTWQQDSATGPWWPECVSHRELHARRTSQPGPQRPSWCYGTPGIARALQLAGIATADTRRRQLAEHALAGCISDFAQLRRITAASLCHGSAGFHRTTRRIAADALTPALSAHLPSLADALLRSHALAREDGGTRPPGGLLEGRAGLTLALHAAARPDPPVTGWDSFLLIN